MLRARPGMLAESFEHFRRCGENRRECVVYWTGPRDEPDVVDRVEHPLHKATRASYEVDSAWVTSFFLLLRRDRHTTRVQVHTHPNGAGHSETDDRFSLVPAPGFLSLVVPNFGAGPASLDEAFLAEMAAGGGWTPIPVSNIDAQ
jgi:hypothetical protein